MPAEQNPLIPLRCHESQRWLSSSSRGPQPLRPQPARTSCVRLPHTAAGSDPRPWAGTTSVSPQHPPTSVSLQRNARLVFTKKFSNSSHSGRWTRRTYEKQTTLTEGSGVGDA